MNFAQELLRKSRLPTTFNFRVVVPSLLICLVMCAFMISKPDLALAELSMVRRYIFDNFSWFYVLSCAFFVIFLAFLAFGKYGDIRLGDNDETPEFSLLAWFSLLFTAGMGIGIIFLGVAEPLAHFLDPITYRAFTQQAIFQSVFHWSVNAWGIYGVMALAIAFFGFRYKLPLSLRSCFYPLLKEKINSTWGDIIDGLGLCTSIFGIMTTLAYSAIRLTSAFSTNHLTIQWVLGAVFMVAILLSLKNLGEGLRYVCNLNLTLSLLLMLFVLLVGPTVYLLNSFSENIGVYLSGVVDIGFRTYVYDPNHLPWFKSWTILYWAWWFAWAPAFGIFIARISRGRTIREFIFGILVVPSLFFILWFTVFGNGAIWINQHIANNQLAVLVQQSGKLLFAFLDYLPFSQITYFVTVVIIFLFFVTTVDFGIYILNNIASKDKSLFNPVWQNLFWGALLAITTFILFEVGGIDALQATLLVFSLPFVVIMLVIAYNLMLGVRFDYAYYHTKVDAQRWVTDDWRESLTSLLALHNKGDAMTYLKFTALPAMRELRQELIGIHDVNVYLDADFHTALPSLTLTVNVMSGLDFTYRIQTERYPVETNEEIQGAFAKKKAKPQLTYSLCVYSNALSDSPAGITMSNGYDIQHLSKKALIGDILQKYDLFRNQYPLTQTPVGNEN